MADPTTDQASPATALEAILRANAVTVTVTGRNYSFSIAIGKSIARALLRAGWLEDGGNEFDVTWYADSEVAAFVACSEDEAGGWDEDHEHYDVR